MITAAALPIMPERALPPATIAPDQFAALAAHIQAAGHARAPDRRDPFAVLVAAVRPSALATLAALVGFDEDAIAVIEEAQVRGRCVTLTPRPDWGFSLSIAAARDDPADAADPSALDLAGSRFVRA